MEIKGIMQYILLLYSNKYFPINSIGKESCNISFYYKDRCELWGFIREINSDISHVKYQFFPTGTTFTQLYVWFYGEYTYDCNS